MLEIRTAQLSSLRGPRRAQIFDSLQPLIERHFPTKSRVLGPEALRQAMEHGVERAIAHGLTTAHPVARFFGLMIVFGSELDTDPLHPWAGLALQQDAEDPLARTQALHRAALTTLQAYVDASEGAWD